MNRIKTSAVRIGISGWRYGGWRGKFYPVGLPQREELSYASRMFRSIELNGSFYSLQTPESYRRWYGETPDDFVFSVKGSRFITHMKKLNDPEAALANFFASGVLCLEEKLGPFLWQLPPQLAFRPEMLERFFALLPEDSKSAARLAAGHDGRLKSRAAFKIRTNRKLRHALEVRHQSFNTPELAVLLQRYGVALVIADTAGRWPLIQARTADFHYLRLHGDEELYASGYTGKAIRMWARRITSLLAGDVAQGIPSLTRKGSVESGRRCRTVYVYFDNDAKVRAPHDAAALEAVLRRQK